LGCLGSVGYVLLAEAFSRMRVNPHVETRLIALKTSIFHASSEPDA
jgi:hypothetical protein